MTLEKLCDKIELPKEVQKHVFLFANSNIPTELLYAITQKESAQGSYQKLKIWCKQKNKGFDMLAYMLLAALHTYQAYHKIGIEEDIYFETMKCFPRFIREHKASYGYYGFDRAWWAYRQLSMTLFKIGELEYEFKDNGQTIHLHIPTNANIALPMCQASLKRFQVFAKKYFGLESKYPIMINSWLLSPALDMLLQADSKIILFKNCFKMTTWDKNDIGFLQWVYGRKDIEYSILPTETRLQKNIKEYLIQGGKVGSAKGILIDFNTVGK